MFKFDIFIARCLGGYFYRTQCKNASWRHA